MTEDTKMDLQSMDVAAEKRKQLKQLFPEVFSEEKVDVDALRRVLGDFVEGGKERFGLNWPGKAECMKVIQAPSVATLKPCRDESVNFDDTGNLFIEGDNLEVLKLLQKSYFGKIKMIYIDPPYNTGKEFIYPDKYAENLDTYLAYTGQIDAEGKKFSTNSEAVGRRHSNWLNMMYPRLYLGRNLLTQDGAVFISIDENEQNHLRSLCNIIFGTENYLGTIIWKNATDNNPTNVAIEHEYVLVYAKDKDSLDPVWKSLVSDVKSKLIEVGEKLISEFDDLSQLQAEYNKWFKQNKPYLWPLDRYKYIDKGGVYTGSQSVHNPGKEGYRYDVIHPDTGRPCKEPLMGYRFPKETMDNLLEQKKILFGDDENKIIELKVYAKDFQDKLSSLVELDGRLGPYDLKELFPELKKAFTNPKPVRFISHFMPYMLKSDEIVLDFFAGSCSTAQAVYELNNLDGGSRRFILSQLPEPCSSDSDAPEIGLANITDVGKERIRRSGNKLQSDNGKELQLEDTKSIDLGFRVLKLSTSNFKTWNGDPEAFDETGKQLEMHIDHVDDAASAEDILYELLLKAGFELTTKIETVEFAGKEVFSIAEGALLICLEKEITSDLIDAMAEADPFQVICLDEAFQGNDQLKTNAVQTFAARAAAQESEIVFRTV
ncbi:site-specific DNA-methyltransferase [Terasakiella sp.]|uniref:site-specific DNA-methyltransferase n=1 Tax=Terasakiella sp. TaxID=2034861 RepID=UPI003AA8BE09